MTAHPKVNVSADMQCVAETCDLRYEVATHESSIRKFF